MSRAGIYNMVFLGLVALFFIAFAPTVLNLICFWGWQLPLAWFLAFPVHGGPVAVFAAIAIAYSTFAILAFFMFRRGKWKGQKL